MNGTEKVKIHPDVGLCARTIRPTKYRQTESSDYFDKI